VKLFESIRFPALRFPVAVRFSEVRFEGAGRARRAGRWQG